MCACLGCLMCLGCLTCSAAAINSIPSRRPELPQLCIQHGGGLTAALGCMAERFPTATKIEVDDSNLELDSDGFWLLDEQLTSCLAALPDGCSPAAEEFGYSGTKLLAPAAIHVPRLCPQLRRISFECNGNSATAPAPAIEGLTAVAGTLEDLDFEFNLNEIQFDLIDAHRTAAALARLSSLRQLTFVSET